jgi:hypothetical protein
MPVVIEAYEATLLKSSAIVLTFDTDDFAPAGNLISAEIESGMLILEWADKTRAMLPDGRDKLAAYITAAPTISVRWLADGLLRGADFARR